ncbi:MAG: HU family DNA-binding protein [Porphyromonadaceae bacterium]|nr:HU family DNA-binding protein [Porphyromonadaceae bacterium]
MEKITKKEMIENVKDTLAITKESATLAVDAVIEVIVDSLKNGNQVYLREIGTIEPYTRPERQGINPATGEKITIKESTGIRFKASKSLKESINQ